MSFFGSFSSDASLTWKTAVRAASTADVPLSGATPLQVDNVTLVNNDRVLLKNQALPEQNGIYAVAISGGTYTLIRSNDANTLREVLPNMCVPISEGNTHADQVFQLVTNSIATLDVTPLSFVLASVTDHGLLQGLNDDDHTQYHNDTRADTWLGTKTTTNLAEGTNLYFTNQRAKDAVISQNITNGVTDLSPSENAVFDALALKVDSVSGTAPIVSSGGTTPAISINDFQGTDGVLPGSKGSVPAPSILDVGKYLKADGTWSTITTLPPYSQDKVLYSTASGAEWRIAGLGSSDSTYPTATVILGAAKPAGLTGTKNILIGTTFPALTTDANNIVISNNWSAGSSYGSQNTIVGIDAGVNYGDNVGIGHQVSTNGFNAVAIGKSSVAWGAAVAVGRGATANGFNGGDIAIGYLASSTAGYGSIALGANTTSPANYTTVIGDATKGGTSTATNCVIIGAASGKTTATGADNIIVGNSAFTSASSGYSNVIIGKGASPASTTGFRNTLVGMESALQLTTGQENVCVGYYAGSTNAAEGITTGNQNVCIGTRSGLRGSTSNYAVSVGAGAAAAGDAVAIGASSYAGQTSIAIGRSAHTGLNSASVAIGYGSLVSVGIGQNGGTQTTALGAYTGGGSLGSGFGLLTRCVYIGAYAGSWSGGKTDEFMLDNQNRGSYANTQSRSLMYGTFNATPSSQTLTFNATTTSTYGLIGNNNGGDFDSYIKGLTDDNLLYVNAGDDRVGIGTAIPAEKLEVNGNVKVSSGDLSIATAGKGLKIAEGADAKMGITGTFPATNPNRVTVNTTAVTASSRIFLTVQSNPLGHASSMWIQTVTAGTSFVIEAHDTNFDGTVAWMIVEPA